MVTEIPEMAEMTGYRIIRSKSMGRWLLVGKGVPLPVGLPLGSVCTVAELIEFAGFLRTGGRVR